ncbi:AhpC/TSA family protein [Pontibacter diazotrophicus]|uniref:AhpC/TSA family protein n=1 Tax=Pontibacter diazotrophicus TaxID=1400979 RepID=A0A3D8L7M7_9BACT|nr:TlpA disulfide reductase family protein [Pontibacter diazotrophicus]RDV13367.1 AhpC/TSA family protein [Pontibacter diazotrophicus]
MKTLSQKAFQILLLAVVVFAPLCCLGQSLSVEGKIDGIGNKKVYLFVRDAHNQDILLDSTVSAKDNFAFTHEPEELGFYTITVDSVPGGVLFFLDSNVQIEGDSKAIWNSSVTGSPLTDEFNDFQRQFIAPVRQKVIALSDSMQDPNLDPSRREELERQQKEIVDATRLQSEKYIKEHPDSFLSLFQLHSLGKEKKRQLLDIIGQELQEHSIAKAIREEAQLEASVSAGKPAPAFTVQDMKGNAVSLADYRGQYVLLDFWGSWCGPCIKLIPETKAAYEKYKGKKVQFMGIAYDEEKDRAKLSGMIEKHGMAWPQIFQDMSDESKKGVVRSYRVTSFPSVILINPEGSIVYRGIGQDGLVEALKVLDKDMN